MTTRSDAEFAGLERTIAELRRDLADSRSAYAERTAQQAATLDVLQAMSASPGDAQPVFDAIARRAREFCQADGSGIVLLEAGNSICAVMRGSRKRPVEPTRLLSLVRWTTRP